MKCLTHCDTSLSLFLSNSDMSAFGVDYSSLDYSNELTRKMLRFYIEIAKSETGFTEVHPTFLECIPQKDGCIVKITNSVCADSVFHVAYGDLNSLLLFSKAICGKYGNFPFTLWRTGESCALSFENSLSREDIAAICLVCKEFCFLTSYDSTAFSLFAEHSSRLFSCSAAFLADYITS